MNLVAIVFPTEQHAEKARELIAELAKEYLITIGDAVIAVKKENNVKLNQMMNLTAAAAANGSFWGLLVGMLFLNPLLGVAVGAGSGAIAGYLSDIGIDDQFMKSLAEELKTGEAVLFVQFKDATKDKVLERLHGIGGRVLHTSLSHDAEDKLQQAIRAE